MTIKPLYVLLAVLTLMGLAGCDLLFPPELPDEEPPKSPTQPEHVVVIEFEDTTGFQNYVAPHTSIVDAYWQDVVACAPGQDPDPCDPAFAQSLPPLAIEMLNDGNASITRILGKIEVYDRQGQRSATLNWFEETFNAKGNQVNVWEMRETIGVELVLQSLCRDPALLMCDPDVYEPENVSRVFLSLEAVEVAVN